MKTGIYFLFHGFILLLIVVAMNISSLSAEEKEKVKIGLIYPLTGPMSSFGEDVARAAPLLQDRFNLSQSKYQFELILEDGKFGQTNAAITAAKKLVEVDGVRFLVVGSSGEILQIAPYLESSQILTVAGFASHPAVREAGDYIFRTYIDAGVGIQSVIADLDKKGVTRIGIISEESSFTSAIKEALAKGLGTKLIFSEDYLLEETDLKALTAKVRSKNLEALYLNTTTPANFITLFKQLRANGVTSQFYTYYVPSIKDVQESLGRSMNGTLYLDFPEVQAASSDFLSFAAELQSKTGNEVRSLFNFRTNYNAIKVVYDGIMDSGSNPSKVKEFLYSYNRPSATGQLQFDEKGDAKDLFLILKTYTFSKN